MGRLGGIIVMTAAAVVGPGFVQAARAQVEVVVNSGFGSGPGGYSVTVVTPFNAYSYANAGIPSPYGGVAAERVGVATQAVPGMAPSFTGSVSTAAGSATALKRYGIAQTPGPYSYAYHRSRFTGPYAPRYNAYASDSVKFYRYKAPTWQPDWYGYGYSNGTIAP
jgi:hypothetical protein